MKVTFGYSDSEDRMWIRAGDGAILWWITRRLGLRLIAQWSELLERTAPAAEPDGAEPSAAPAADPQERVRRARQEHLDALAAPSPSDGDEHADAAAKADSIGVLLFSAEISVNAGKVRLVLHSGDKRQAIVMPRRDAHRMLATILERCRGNGWIDAPIPDWLRGAPGMRQGAGDVVPRG